MTPVLDREEYIEQAYFFRVLRDRLLENLPTQQVLTSLHQEILSTTTLPLAVQFVGTELKHSGLLSSGFAKLPHYFTPFQTLVIRKTEDELGRFSVDTGLLLLQREAEYRSGTPTQPGLFVFALEAMSRNRLGYDEGLVCLQHDGFFAGPWHAYFDFVKKQVGSVDLCNLIYVRSELYLADRRRRDPEFMVTAPALFGEKEGKIARANLGRDPLYLFAALQRQLGYPMVPRQRPKDDPLSQVGLLQAKVRELEQRVKLVEGELRGKVDLSPFLARPDLPADDEG